MVAENSSPLDPAGNSRSLVFGVLEILHPKNDPDLPQDLSGFQRLTHLAPRRFACSFWSLSTTCLPLVIFRSSFESLWVFFFFFFLFFFRFVFASVVESLSRLLSSLEEEEEEEETLMLSGKSNRLDVSRDDSELEVLAELSDSDPDDSGSESGSGSTVTRDQVEAEESEGR